MSKAWDSFFVENQTLDRALNMQQVSAGDCRLLQRLRGFLSFAAVILPAEFGWCLWLEMDTDCSTHAAESAEEDVIFLINRRMFSSL